MGQTSFVPSPARWELWSVARPRWIAYALACEAAAAGLTVAGFVDDGIGGRADATWFVVLLVLGIAQTEMCRQIEQRVRRWVGGQTHINVTSVWCLAGAVLLSPALVALLAAALYAHLWVRVWRYVNNRPTHRTVASTAWLMLACWSAAEFLRVTGLGRLDDTEHGAEVVLVAAAVFELVNLVGVAGSVVLYTRKRSVADIVGTWVENALELVTLCLGGLTAIALVHDPLLVVLIYPPLLLLHPHVLVKRLEVAVATDEKTGLLNNAGWRHLASQELDRAQRSSTTLAIFMVDIDHFKKINDTHGHLAGDIALKAVATTINHSVRDYDTVGRFGGEEFVVLLPGIPAPDVDAAAERVRCAVTQLTVPVGDEAGTTVKGLSVSVGTAFFPTSGTALDRLVHAADSALLVAKRRGRNRIVHADPRTAPTRPLLPTQPPSDAGCAASRGGWRSFP